MKYGLPDGDSNFARLLHLRNNRLSLQNIINLEQQVKQLQQLQNDLKELGIDKNNLKGEVTKLRHDLTNKTKENQLQKNLFEAVKASVRGLSNNIWTQVENSNRVKAVLSELTKLTQQAQVAVPPK
jgi:predicted  nucleic acid-binding Zn-ribbon protein